MRLVYLMLYKNLVMRKKIIAYVLFFTVLLGGSLFVHRKVQAFLPFGGMITFVRVCTCPGALWVQVSPPVGGAFLFVPGASTLFANGNISLPGSWVLGLHSAIPTSCGTWEEGECLDQWPAQGIMTIVGTS